MKELRPVAVIDQFFAEVKKHGASDLHMPVGYPPLMRLHGELVPMKHPVLTAESNQKILFEILSPQKQQYLMKNRDLDAAYESPGVARFRCNFFYQIRGLSAVFRIIPTEISSLDKIGLPPVLKKIAEFKRGLALVTGPTGSGKSTTLAAIINHINENRSAHILTIEDPIEFVHPNKNCLFTQREIGTHARSFAEALRIASREDPNIIMVGEMRDHETISLALTCAELGILVFGTLHTNSAAKTIDRIINVFPAEQQSQCRSMLADALVSVVAQQLVKTKDGKGRRAAVEVLLGSTALSSIIREGKISQINSMIQTGTKHGMQSMDQHLMALIQSDTITHEAAYEKAIDKTKFLSSGAE